MAQTQYRANLSAKDFSFRAAQWGRSVILKQFDQNFSRQIVSPTDPDKDVGIPQIYYCHNVMPSGPGFQSVALFNVVPGFGAVNFKYIKRYSNPGLVDGYLGFVQVGDSYNIYALQYPSLSWTYVTNIAATAQAFNFNVSVATINGTTYVLIPFTNCYTFDGTNLNVVTLAGVTVTGLQGLVDSFGYMIVWDGTTIAWSSTLDPTDFTPSLITGAGGGAVQALKGSISICYHHGFGFVIYSENNAVAATYSGNARFPFNFREIIGCGGCTDSELIGIDADSGNQYVWTTDGLQLVSITQAVNVFPELTNFIGGDTMEDFDTNLLQLVTTFVSIGTLQKKLNVISNRYLVISYGITEYTHALIYDIGMKRWGKIKLTHIASFEYRYLPTRDSARTSLGFVDSNGAIYTVDFADQNQAGQGVMILGKYQHTRNRLITLQQVDVEGVENTNSCSVYDLMTLDGKNWLPAVPLIPISATVLNVTYTCRITGMNHSLLFIGDFKLDSLMLSYIPSGRR